MSNNMDELFANVKKMVDSGNIPDDVKPVSYTHLTLPTTRSV